MRGEVQGDGRVMALLHIAVYFAAFGVVALIAVL